MKSQSSGCTERVAMSRLSWRSFRSSAQPIAAIPSRSRRSPATSCSGSAQAAREPAASTCISEAPSFRERSAGRGGEDLVERVDAELAGQLSRRSLRGEQPVVHDRDAVALAFGLLHLV